MSITTHFTNWVPGHAHLALLATFSPGVMPQDFGSKLGDQDIDDLIAFLMTK